MCIRSVPYGYMIENGKKIVVPQEATIIIEVYERYNAGETFKQIADSLTEREIIYFQGNSTWNKNNIARMIDDARYLGNEDYPQIVSNTLFAEVRTCREGRSAKKAELPSATKLIKEKLVCGQCGKGFNRKNKWRTREKWMCRGGCKCSAYLDDKTIFNGISKAIGGAAKQEVHSIGRSVYEPNSEITRLTNDVYRMMEQSKIEFKTIANAILECASARFDCCSMGGNAELTQAVLEAFEQSSGADVPDEDLIAKTIEQIIVDQDGKITLLLKSGVQIKGEI